LTEVNQQTFILKIGPYSAEQDRFQSHWQSSTGLANPAADHPAALGLAKAGASTVLDRRQAITAPIAHPGSIP